jgi:hypothetical protein
MRRKFVEYLGTDCFNFRRIPVELHVSVVSMSNTKCTNRSSKCTDNFIAYIVHDEREGRGSIFHLFLPISPQENNEKMVNSEPSNLRKK